MDAGAGVLITGLLVMAALTYKLLDLTKYMVVLVRAWGSRQDVPRGRRPQGWEADEHEAFAEARNGLVTLLLGSVAGVLVVMTMANTGWSGEIPIGNESLADLSSVSQLVLGLVLTSIAGVMFDGKKAIDATDSASTLKLFQSVDKTRRSRVKASLGVDPVDLALRRMTQRDKPQEAHK